jgi:hypothetical protein
LSFCYCVRSGNHAVSKELFFFTMNEFEWENLLKQSDARTAKFHKLFEKYVDHPDREALIAREMGWKSVENHKDVYPLQNTSGGEEYPSNVVKATDWICDETGCLHHPLSYKIMNKSVEMHNYCRELEVFEKNKDVVDMISQFQITGVKISGALDHLGLEDETDNGFIIACLKRALSFLHLSIAASEKVSNKNLLPQSKIVEYRQILFEVREEILNLMNRFRKLN